MFPSKMWSRILIVVLGAVFIHGQINSIDDIDWTNVKPFRSGFNATVYVAPDRRINNGEVAGPTDIPFIVGVLVSLEVGTHFCGGVLISRTHVLTSGACVFQQDSITVMFGASDMSRPSDFVLVSHVRVHPDYSTFWTRGDIAILTLAREPRFNDRVQIATLARRVHEGYSFNRYTATISGWGETGSHTDEPLPMRELRFVRSDIITNLSCELSYPVHNIRRQHVCSSTDNGAPCVGDEGGPVTVTENGETFVIAIHSFTASRGCERGRPAVHTRITEFFDWIEMNSDAEIKP